ncbi:hypothetical protein HDU99_001144 [Rhizoclosmatium hyalinum]|nr:hypothetical protein HDU99_001144 [Rhizoclosmatium hyalinum]
MGPPPRVFLVPELLSLIVTHLSASDVSQLSLVSRVLAYPAQAHLFRRPAFSAKHAPTIRRLIDASPRTALTHVRDLDIAQLRVVANPTDEAASPLQHWLDLTRLAHDLVAACPNLRTLRIDGFPSDVTGTLFSNLLLSIPNSIEHILWSRVAVSDAHLMRMVGRWPKLRSLEIGIVTPYMWGVRSTLSGMGSMTVPEYRMLSMNGVGGADTTQSIFPTGDIRDILGATAASNYGGPDWKSIQNAEGFSTLLSTSLRLESLKIQPLPGDDGTTHLLQILTLYSPPSLKTLILGRGRYLTSTQSSSLRLWHHVLLFISRNPRITHVSIADPFETCRRFCLPVWVLSESFLQESERKLRKQNTATSSGDIKRAVADVVHKELRAWIRGDGRLDKLVKINQNVGLRWFLGGVDQPATAITSHMNEALALFRVLPTVPNSLAEVNDEDGGDQLVPLAETAETTVVRHSGALEPIVFGETGIRVLRSLVDEFSESTVLTALAKF